MFGSIIAGLGFVLAGIVAFVLAIVTLVRGLVIPSRYVGAHCGICGHAVEFNQRGDQCPECGSVLTEVGVVTRALAARFRAGPVVLHSAWIFICTSLLTLACYAIMVASVVTMGAGGGFGAMTTTATVTPAAAPAYEFEFEVESASGAGPATTMRVELLVDGVASPSRLEVDGPTAAWSLIDAADLESDSGTQLDAAAFEALLTAAEVELTDERAEEASLLAERAAAALQEPVFLVSYMDGSGSPTGANTGMPIAVPAGPQPLLVTASGSSFGNMGPNFMMSGLVGSLIALGVILLLYIGGVVFIEIRRRKLTGGRRTM